MTLERKINAALVYSGMSQTELAEKLGMTRSNLNQRIKRESFKTAELEKIAEALGAKYSFCFEFEDGTKI